ncbi:MAG: CinA family nicotinamide mononucleotide deamidase-related protein [Oscillospiraceae bacterium]|nr:CinA family nicotinamide mononucleotide deamidase-related protein [Oscillospiraceae bacterium]
MNAEIITVGNDDQNSRFLTHELAAFGIELTHLTHADGDCHHLRDALRIALSRNDLVVIVGGLENDNECRSLNAVSYVIGVPLVIHNESLERISEYYRNTGREMPEDSRQQAMLPEKCYVFPNDHGIAPGCAVTRYGQHIIMLPKSSGELMPMFSDYVAPYLSNLTNGTIVSRTIGVFGLSEAALNERLADLMSEANPGVVSYSKDGEAILRVTARAKDRNSAYELCNPVVEEIRQRLGINVFGVDIGSLQKAVVALLLDKNMKIATAESCTAGLLSSRLTEVTGTSAVFECGIAAYSPEIKHSVLKIPKEMIEEFGTVSPEIAGAMAVGVRRISNASIGVGITGVAGPDQSEGKPVGTVYIAVADEKRVWVKKIAIEALGEEPDRESIRALATSHALDLVRRYLEALPAVMAGGELLQSSDDENTPVIPKSDVSKKRKGILQRILPWKGDSKFEILIKLALLTSFAILLGMLLSFVYTRVLRPLENQRLFRNLADMYSESNPVIPADSDLEFPDGMLTQFYALYARNSDVRGWVKIDGTNINYPIMRYTSGLYYDSHNFDKQPSFYGVPYFSSRTALISQESVNRSIVVYGKNTNDGQMFSDLLQYYDNIDFLRQHPVIEMDTIYQKAHWKIFSVMVLKEPDGIGPQFDYTQAVFTDEADFLSFAGNLRTRSLYNMPSGQVDVQEGDSLLMLSTGFEQMAKFEGARLVVAARKVRPGEQINVDLAEASYNSNAVMPSEWPKQDSGNRQTQTNRVTATTSSTRTAATSTESDSNETLTSTTSSHKQVTTLSNHSTSSTNTTKYEPTGPTEPSTTSTTNTTSGSTSKTATTTSSSAPTTSTPTSPTSSGDYITPEIIAGSQKESIFLSDCKVIINGETEQPKTKQELQMLLARIVKAEIGSSSMMANDCAAQKAQAIASYSYILYFNRENNKACTVPAKTINLNNTVDKKIYDAVGKVVGIKLLSGNNPVCAVYSASTPGFTSSNHEVYEFGRNLEYLQSVVSEYETAAHMPDSWKSTCTVPMQQLKDNLKNYLNTDIDFEQGDKPFFIKSFDKNGHYVLSTNAYYYKNGEKKYVSGHQLRMAIGPSILRSHAFKVTSSTEQSLTLSVTGYGHGIGLSQWGAANYAKYAGWDYRQILSHYYSITDNSHHRLVYPVW